MMSILRNMKVINKLLFLIFISMLALIAVSFYGYYSAGIMHDQAEVMYKDQLQAVKTLNTARAYFCAIQADVTELLVTTDQARDKELLKDINVREDTITGLLNEFKKTEMDAYEIETIKKLDNQLQYGLLVREKLLQMIATGDKEEAYRYFRIDYTPCIDDVNNTLSKLADYNAKAADTLQKENASKFNSTVHTMLAVCILAILVSLGMGILIAGLIIKPIRHLEEVMNKAGQGDFTVRDTLVYQDEIGELIRVFNNMLEEQGRVISVVRQASVQLAGASEEMAASSEEVSASETTISNSVQQVAQEAERGTESVLEASKVLLELSSLIQIAKSKGTSATSNSAATMEAAVMGQETVTETVDRMLHIKDKTIETENLIVDLSKYSDQIGLITDTITSIASETNLLALNAAIEAARAGEAGRGFAVVAEEVRKLAEQSDQGAGEVAALVKEVAARTAAAVSATQQSRIEVEEGVKSVNEAGKALEHILAAVKSTVKDVGGIVEVTNEETATSEKVVNLINTLATVVENTAAHIQQVAASMEQTTAAMETIAASAEQTNSMANELETEVERFTV